MTVKNIATISSDFLQLPSFEEIKRYLLLFDSLCFCNDLGIDLFEMELQKSYSDFEDYLKLREQKLIMKPSELVIDSNVSEEKLIQLSLVQKICAELINEKREKINMSIDELLDKFIPDPNNVKQLSEFQEIELGKALKNINQNQLKLLDESLRVTSVLLNNLPNIISTPVITKDMQTNNETSNSMSEKVIGFVLKKFPVPKENNRIESILNFKSDRKNKEFLHGLRVWINSLNSENFNMKYFIQEYEHKYEQYSNTLEEYEIDTEKKGVTILVTTSFKILENLMWLKPSEAFQAYLDYIKDGTIPVAVERTAPGNDLAYIYHANKYFE